MSIRISSDGLYFWKERKVAFDSTSGRPLSVDDHGLNKKSLLLTGSGGSTSLSSAQIQEAGRNTVKDMSGNTILQLDTCKSILVPSELFRSDHIDKYVEINNFDVSPEERVVVSDNVQDTVSINICSGGIIDSLTEIARTEGGSLSIVSSLQYSILIKAQARAKKRQLKVYFTSSNTHVTLFNTDGSLLFADSVPIVTDEDILFYLKHLSNIQSFNDTDIYIFGDNAKTKTKFLRNYFTKCKCV